MKITKYQDNIMLVTFDTQQELTETLLRPQEYYESPEFAGKVFDIAEYATWYKTTKEHGQFSYYTDWVGFNIPQKVIKNFLVKYAINSFFYQAEQDLFKALDQNGFFNTDDGYMIAISKEEGASNGLHRDNLLCVHGDNGDTSMVERQDTVRHELVHATYYIDHTYRKRVDTIIGWHLDPRLYRSLANKIKDMGYHENVLDDEVNAYLIDLHEDGNFRFEMGDVNKYKEIAEKLATVYNQHKRKPLCT